MAPAATDTQWSVDYDTLRRENLFQNPPKDHTAYPSLAESIRPHIDSFNALFEDSKIMEAGLRDIGTKTFLDGELETYEQKKARQAEGLRPPKRNRLNVRVREIFLEKPTLPPTNKFTTRNREIYPSECRERHATYRGKLRARLEYQVNNGDWMESVRELGNVPIMVRTNRCHLEKATPEELVRHKEESEELGGFYIVNGNEKLIRMLIVGKRNFPMSIIRGSFVKRGQYLHKVRCSNTISSSRSDLADQCASLPLRWKRDLPFLMAQERISHPRDDDSQGAGRDQRPRNLRIHCRWCPVQGHEEHLRHRPSRAFPENLPGLPASTASTTAGPTWVRLSALFSVSLRTCPMRKLAQSSSARSFSLILETRMSRSTQDYDKFKMIIFMIRKLYATVAGDCAPDNPDAVSNQEILLGGFLYGMILKERIEEWLRSFGPIARDWSIRNNGAKFTDPAFERDFLSKIVKRSNENIGNALEYFLSTGNLVSPTGLDLQQTSGYTVIAEKINFYRFISHFRMIHRGSFFAQLKTTTVRKLLPESWGFLCPVHTPDGSPCGLLNHLAHKCLISTGDLEVSHLPRLLVQLGVRSESSVAIDESVVVQLDGRIIGFCSPKQAQRIARHPSVLEGRRQAQHPP